ncbi:MAG: DUF6190 family protein [Patescibacteria group bacterium]
MKKIMFDATIHLGQFSLANEELRLAAKGSQALISLKGQEKNIGVITYNENSLVDDIIWNLKKDDQDIFYRFMDSFHTVQNIERVEIDKRQMGAALEILQTTNLPAGLSLNLAAASIFRVSEIYTYYPKLLQKSAIEMMRDKFGIIVTSPPIKNNPAYQRGLEKIYVDTFDYFKSNKIDLFGLLQQRSFTKE